MFLEKQKATKKENIQKVKKGVLGIIAKRLTQKNKNIDTNNTDAKIKCASKKDKC